MSDKKVWRAIDVFSGCGGLSDGLKQAGFKIESAVELDPLAADTYASNHDGVRVVQKDVRRVTRTHLQPKNGEKIDLIAGCPPCQGFSRVRRRNRRNPARDDRNALIDEFERLVSSLNPTAIFLENVPGIQKYWRFKQFIAFLKRKHYEVTVEVLDLSLYGVPQTRKRVVVLAGKRFKIQLPKRAKFRATVRRAIGDLPCPKRSRKRLHRTTTKHADDVKIRIRSVPKNGGSRNSLPKKLILACHRKCSGFRDVYGRMPLDKPGPTITGGCINASKGRFLHPKQDRVITLYEAALLQTFPRSYHFNEGRGRYGVAEMIGNALPPEFARRVGVAILEALTANDDD